MLDTRTFTFNALHVTTCVLSDETKEAVIIDCGAYSDKEKIKLMDYFQFNKLKLKHVLNTHLHFDHILGNHFLYEKFGLKPQYHPADEDMPGLKEGITKFGFTTFTYTHVIADHYLKDKDVITFGNTTLEVLETPGHSPGSLSFYCESDARAYTGDALFKEDIGRTDLWKGNHEELLHSIKTKLLTLPDKTVFYPGHGEISAIGYEKQNNSYFNT
jgi:glyoxylase-like metal-dependent hydrolase (beta-lactamase superfamily II)